MGEPFVGSEAVRSGRLTAYALRTRYVAIHPDVYLPRGAQLTPLVRAQASWLWTGRRGILAGHSASALRGARWIDAARNAEIVHDNRHRRPGITVWSGKIAPDEICVVRGMRATTAARTALDLACRCPRGRAVAAIDALCRATELQISEALELASRHAGMRGIRRARTAFELVDPGAQSPKETWLRLLLRDAGLPPVSTQILVHNGDFVALAYIDMGWEDVMVGIEYDGDQHRSDRRQYLKDIRRLEMLEGMGWLIVRVVAEDHPHDIIRRVREALARRA
ncbi:endonuclease domain-containing protein [Mycobacteroides abscessus]|uniref:endonuclease domain-containing protein n=1 Tax=Mycobacteroides abscessus TaxID=36809 RepID=UPI000926B0BF|nr:hypothetical protein [Mycobacteroides abscessus]MCU8692466.1 hypothetical protein [Mycobacteroides abscessus]MCU8711675.1 hypothetical protein [Mycobacteroides abscessus]MCU8716421.1 hypothetical protein [Mycobacteroides abscessus]MCU8750436.1 hypothetical protein [Mycobacteroides abscessus]MCU8761431.1 hypothetical protein [Mycobacteroides abscessus]